MKIRVECYSGYRVEEVPRRVRFGERSLEVLEILDRWIGPDHRYFKLITDDRSVMIVRYDVETWEWDLCFYQGENPTASQGSSLEKSPGVPGSAILGFPHE
ncbi:MAG: hypothetical protein ACOWWM_20270 [Desulfobacterales bacterium]